MLSGYLKRYERKKTFLDYFAKDLEDGHVWYNSGEFARYHIFAKNIATGSMMEKTSDEAKPLGVNNAEGVLFCRAQDVSGVKADQTIMLDGKEYLVTNATLIQEQIWRIELARVQE